MANALSICPVCTESKSKWVLKEFLDCVIPIFELVKSLKLTLHLSQKSRALWMTLTLKDDFGREGGMRLNLRESSESFDARDKLCRLNLDFIKKESLLRTT